MPTVINAISALEASKRPDCRIYVGSLQYELTEANIRALFSSFGNIREIDMSLEPGTNRSKGFCFITYDNPASAEAALALNGMEVAGRKVKRAHSCST